MQAAKNAKHRLVQQQSPHWNPKLTLRTTLPMFLIVGVLFVGVGCAILFVFRNAHEVIVDYTQCVSTASNDSRACADVIGSSTHSECRCQVPFDVAADIEAPVFLYYRLTNFFQNHRTYLMSRDNRQLMGELSDQVSAECAPLDYAPSDEDGGARVPIAPCGAIANSMFSDELTVLSVNHSAPVPVSRTGIAWPQIKGTRYRNPPGGDLRKAFENFSKPVAWTRHVWELDAADPSNNGFENEDFIVWMQPATLSTFRKIYRRVDHAAAAAPFDAGLPRGRYTLQVRYTYPVATFGGTKSLIIANTTVLGTRNLFLGIAYLVTGCICLVIAIIFFGLRVRYKKLA